MNNGNKQRTAADHWLQRRPDHYFSEDGGRSRAIRTFIVVAALSGVGACSMPRRAPDQRVADADTASHVKAALSSDQRLYARHIDVTVVDGVAHLKGQIWSNDEIRFAHEDAAAVPGVKDVDDEMELVRGGAR